MQTLHIPTPARQHFLSGVDRGAEAVLARESESNMKTQAGDLVAPADLDVILDFGQHRSARARAEVRAGAHRLRERPNERAVI